KNLHEFPVVSGGLRHRSALLQLLGLTVIFRFPVVSGISGSPSRLRCTPWVRQQNSGQERAAAGGASPNSGMVAIQFSTGRRETESRSERAWRVVPTSIGRPPGMAMLLRLLIGLFQQHLIDGESQATQG